MTLSCTTPEGEGQQSFKPGSIHGQKEKEFWEKDLKAGSWVKELLKDGYIIPFTKMPEPYEEDNNGSAKQNMDFVRKAVNELLEQGVIEIVKTKPTCVSPLTVASRVLPDGTIKHRLCWDGSRHVNLLIKEQPVKLAHLQRALDITHKGDFQIKYDLKSAYHHIKIHKKHRQYLGAAFTNQKGDKVYFIFKFLPFGLSSAVHAITKLFKPINAYFHTQGIRHTIFLDDGRGLAESAAEAEGTRAIIYDVLQKAGWIREEKKSDKKGEASQVKEYLGFVINTQEMTVGLSTEKKDALVREIKETTKLAPGSKVAAKELAKILGKIVSTEPALGNFPLLTVRAGYILLDQATTQRGWNTWLNLDEPTLAGLKMFLQNMDRFDNTPIRTEANNIAVLSIVGPPSQFLKTSHVSNHARTDKEEIWASDASGFATCAYSVSNGELYFRGMLSQKERELSSGHRELLAVKHSLEYYLKETGNKSNQYRNVYWITDSENLVKFLTKGSGKQHIQADIFETLVLSQKLKFNIIPIHLRREDPRVQAADQGSKIKDSDNWSVDAGTFMNIHSSCKFTIDLFADNNNNKCPKFYSNFYCENTSGIDAFSHSWDGEVAWVCPPINSIIRVIQKIRCSEMTGTLFIPEWTTADFWWEIFDKNNELKTPFKSVSAVRPFLIQNSPTINSPFTGRAKFNFLQIQFENEKRQ